MPEKLYVDVVGSGLEIPEGYETIVLMRLPAEKATRKANLLAKIRGELEALNKEFPKPKDSSQLEQWGKDYRLSHQQRVSPLHREDNQITGPLEEYVVEAGHYRIGQVLDYAPAGAIPLDEFLERL